jgi:hypothetical protein
LLVLLINANNRSVVNVGSGLILSAKYQLTFLSLVVQYQKNGNYNFILQGKVQCRILQFVSLSKQIENRDWDSKDWSEPKRTNSKDENLKG